MEDCFPKNLTQLNDLIETTYQGVDELVNQEVDEQSETNSTHNEDTN